MIQSSVVCFLVSPGRNCLMMWFQRVAVEICLLMYFVYLSISCIFVFTLKFFFMSEAADDSITLYRFDFFFRLF